jgi:hypothetical protein
VPGIGHLHPVLHMPHHTWWQVWEENGLIWKPWEDEELQATKSDAKLRLYVTSGRQVLCVVMLL